MPPKLTIAVKCPGIINSLGAIYCRKPFGTVQKTFVHISCGEEKRDMILSASRCDGGARNARRPVSTYFSVILHANVALI
jgi:hypothetical protein